jgi:hypothetical protein
MALRATCRNDEVDRRGVYAVLLAQRRCAWRRQARGLAETREVALGTDCPRPGLIGLLVGCDLQPTVSS